MGSISKFKWNNTLVANSYKVSYGIHIIRNIMFGNDDANQQWMEVEITQA